MANELFPTLWATLGPRRVTPTQRRSLLRLIATAAEERMQLAPLLDAWAHDERGGQRGRLRRLANTLRDGVALPDALERVPGALSDEEVLLVRFASQSGSLASTLRQRVDAPSDPTAGLQNGIDKSFDYLLVFLLVALPIALFFCVAVLPAFEQIFNEFGLDPPYAMQVASSVAAAGGYLWLVAALVLAAVVFSRVVPQPARFLRRTLSPWLLKPIRHLRVAGVLDRLAETASAGRPLPGAISTLARYHYDPSLRHKLLFVRNELELGAELWPALTTTGLLSRPEKAALEAADRVEASGWTLGALAERRRGQATKRLRLWAGVAFPLAILAFGAFVLSQALGVFSSLLHLTTSLA